RHEASTHGNGSITPEHLLLGILREDPLALKTFGLSDDAIASLEEDIYRVMPECAIATSVDMPLSAEAANILSKFTNADDRSIAINPFDILEAIARQEGTHAAALLRDRRTPADPAT